MIDVECVNSVSNKSTDIISLIMKVCRWFLLNNKIFTFHDLFTFTELIDKQHPLFQLKYYNKLLYAYVGEGYCELLVNFDNADFPGQEGLLR